MILDFNARHGYCFWVIEKEGGITRAAGRLGMAMQIVSTQVRGRRGALLRDRSAPQGAAPAVLHLIKG